MRLDRYLFENGYYTSRTKAEEAITRGEVFVFGKQVLKPSYNVESDADISVSDVAKNFVSNGGYKLEKAFSDFSVDVNGCVCADIGASTGGFTDCLLRRGAKKVFALDVGQSLLDQRLANDPRVTVIDNCNARDVSKQTFGDPIDFAVCDVSFISLTYVLKPIYDILIENGMAVVLIKPQFECGKRFLNKNGIVTNRDARVSALSKILDFCDKIGFTTIDLTFAPIRENKNVEYLVCLTKNGSAVANKSFIDGKIKNLP